MESSPLNSLPSDTLHHIFSTLPLSQIALSKCTCKSLYKSLTSPSFLHLLRSTQPNPLSLLSLKPSSHRHLSPNPTLQSYNPHSNQWLTFSLSFLPFTSLHPITSSQGLLYIWGSHPQNTQKALLVCNPLTCQYKTLPQLGSAWSRHGSVMSGSKRVVIVLTELAVLYYSDSDHHHDDRSNIDGHDNNNNNSSSKNWRKFSSNLPSKPRSPVMIDDNILVLCDVGSPWRSQWAMFKTRIVGREEERGLRWERVEKREWGDVFDILKRPRLVKSGGEGKVYVVGGLKNSYALQSACSTILILRLDLETLDWEEAGRMPVEMYRCFMESSKFKVFGGGDRVCFSAKKVKRLALWEEVGGEGKAEWRWVESVPGSGDGLCRGFVFEARIDAVP